MDKIEEVKKIYPGYFDGDALEFKLCCSHCFNYPCSAPDFCEKAKAYVKDSQLFEPKPSGRLLTENLHHLFCQHCKALQKTNDTLVECWYNPLDEEKRLAFCAANIDAVNELYAKTASIVEIKADHAGYLRGYAQAEQSQTARIEALIEEIENLIIGVEGCEFEERLDGDKGCLVLDMNRNQWDEFKATHTSKGDDNG